MEINSTYYAKAVCDTIMDTYTPQTLPPADFFFYHQGVFLLGMQQLYKKTGEEKYFNYIKEWVDYFLSEDGSIKGLRPESPDDCNPGILFFDIYAKLGEKKYLNGIENVMNCVNSWKKTSEGCYWHRSKETPTTSFHDQIWLDGFYMSSPIITKYANLTGKSEYFDTINTQMEVMWKHMYDEKTGLLYHAWDESREAFWADKETGCSTEIWGRALGWYAAALAMITQEMPESCIYKKSFSERLKTLLLNILKYQDKESGMWFQLVNRVDDEKNWIELSCSALFTLALKKAINEGILDESYNEAVQKAYDGIIKNCVTLKDNGHIILSRICEGTMAEYYDYYINRKQCKNDLHGLGAFLLMCCEF